MALVSNVHYNLTAWASGSFTLGQRCSSGGNAYQCTTAGTSTAAPTGTGTGINNGGSAVFKYLSSIDYTSLTAWAASIPATLTQPVVAALWNNGSITTTSGTPFVSLSGHTTTSSNNITITTAPGEGFASALSANPSLPLAFSATTGVNFVLPSTGVGGINYIYIQDDNVVLNGIQVQDPNATSGSTLVYTAQNTTIQNCIFDGYGQPGGASIINPVLGGASTCVFRFLNCLVIDRASSGGSAANTISGNYNSVYANNTIYAVNSPTYQYGLVDNSAAAGVVITATNNILIGYTAATVVYNTSSSFTVKYCLLSAASITDSNVTLGAGNLYSKTDSGTFVNTASNYSILATSSAVGTGATDTTDIPGATDIIGTSRPTGDWSIGAYQFMNPTSVGTATGHAVVTGASGAGRATGTAVGKAIASGVLLAANQSAGKATGKAIASGVTNGNLSIGTAVGLALVSGYVYGGAINGAITLNNPGPQIVNTPFTVTGTFSLTPELQFSDNSSVNVPVFTPIPSSGISSIGSGPITFVHPGVSTTGQQNLLVEDLSTVASAAVNYPVLSSAPTTPPATSATATLTSLASIIPTYVYEQYHDDDNVGAFFEAYNQMAQVYLDWFNNINIPIYTGTQISGPFLDWVAEGLYGISRPTLAVVQTGPTIGPFNTYTLNTIPFNGSSGSVSSTVYIVTDDIFKRIITWSFYKGDGKTFNVYWLKRRVMRFLAGVNGTDYTGPSDQVSVKFAGKGVVNVTISPGIVPLTAALIFQAAMLSGNLPIPFQLTVNVLINGTNTPPVIPSGSSSLTFNTGSNSEYLPSIF